MNKKNTSGLKAFATGLAFFIFLMIIYVLILIYSKTIFGSSAQRYDVLLRFVPALIILFFLFIVCLVIRHVSEDSSDDETTIIAISSQDSTTKYTDVQLYREYYNLPEDTQLYRLGRIISTYPPRYTRHEFLISELLVEPYAFNPECVFLDNYFMAKDGKTTQIDIIAVGDRGVFVFESKDYTGWIFGNGKQTQWTESYRGGKKYRFYNPIKQNTKHVNTLKAIIGDKPKYYSLIVFGNKASIKNVSYIPEKTYVLTTRRIREVLADLRKEPECLSNEEVLEICRKIQKNRIVPDEKLRQTHDDDIKEMTGKSRLYS